MFFIWHLTLLWLVLSRSSRLQLKYTALSVLLAQMDLKARHGKIIKLQ